MHLIMSENIRKIREFEVLQTTWENMGFVFFSGETHCLEIVQ